MTTQNELRAKEYLKLHPQMFPLARMIAKDVLETGDIKFGLCYTFTYRPFTNQNKFSYTHNFDYYQYFTVILQDSYANLGYAGEMSDRRKHLLETIIAIPAGDMYDILTS